MTSKESGQNVSRRKINNKTIRMRNIHQNSRLVVVECFHVISKALEIFNHGEKNLKHFVTERYFLELALFSPDFIYSK